MWSLYLVLENYPNHFFCFVYYTKLAMLNSDENLLKSTLIKQSFLKAVIVKKFYMISALKYEWHFLLYSTDTNIIFEN